MGCNLSILELLFILNERTGGFGLFVKTYENEDMHVNTPSWLEKLSFLLVQFPQERLF